MTSPVRYWRPFALAALALAPYLHTLRYGFINYDDGYAISALPLIRRLSWRTIPEFFAPDIYAGLPEYMPLKNLSYGLDYLLFGAEAPGFRPQQLLFWVLSVLLVYAWLRLLLRRLVQLERLALAQASSEWVAFGVSALFALHPAHVESVTWLAGRKDVLSGAFVPAALACGLYSSSLASEARARSVRWGVLCLACFALALLSKPTALSVAPLLCLQEYWVTPGASARELWTRLRARAWLLGSAGLMALGFALLYSQVAGRYASAAASGQPNAVLRLGQQLARYLLLVFDPSRLTLIVPESVIDADPTSLAALLGYATLLGLAFAFGAGLRSRHLISFAIGLFVMALLPSLVRPVWGQYVAGRYLYHALLGPLLALGYVCAHLVERPTRPRWLIPSAVIGLGLLWSGVTVGYNSAFRSSDALWAHSIAVDPSVPQFYDMAARAALERRDPERAISVLESCLAAIPDAPLCAAPLGGLMLVIDPPRGEALLMRVLPHDRTGTSALRLAQHWVNHGQAVRGLALYERFLHGSRVRPAQIEALVELAIAAERFPQARAYLRELVIASSVQQPASPPPSAAVLRGAERAADPDLLTRARAAAERCQRSDCFAAALGLLPAAR